MFQPPQTSEKHSICLSTSVIKGSFVINTQHAELPMRITVPCAVGLKHARQAGKSHPGLTEPPERTDSQTDASCKDALQE